MPKRKGDEATKPPSKHPKPEAEQQQPQPQMLVYEYTAAENETPKIIAETLQVSLEELVEINKHYYPGLRANARLREGTVLEVPGTAHIAMPGTHQAAGASAAAPAAAAEAAPAAAPPAAKRHGHKRREWKVGERVEALYPPDGNYYEAIVTAVRSTTYSVEWTEADEESHLHKEVPRDHVRKYRPPTAQELRQAQLEEEWEGETYLSADDETPKHVARRLGVLLSELLRLNRPLYDGLAPTSKLMAGTLLRVPERMDGAPQPTHDSMLRSDLVQTEKVEKLLKRRTTASGATEFLVKLRNRAYIHCEWICTSRFDMDDAQMKSKLKRFSQKSEGMDEDQQEEEEAFLQAAQEVERIVARRGLPGNLEYLVKWVGVEYEGVTWESENDEKSAKALADAAGLIENFNRWSTPPDPNDSVPERKKGTGAASLMKVSLHFKDHNQLRDYQLDGCRWLLHCWQQGHGCILADEMGLGKTVQSVTFLESLRKLQGRRGPFLIVAPLSTIPHWHRECEGWTDMNTVVYHGTTEDRAVIRKWEFQFPGVTGNVLKFEVLITTYETVIQDIGQLSKYKWAALVVDEAHRLKNHDCTLARQLRTLQVEHTVLLTGTPLQNNTAELWSLLNFADRERFWNAEDFDEKFGDVKNAAQVESLKAELRQYMLRRMKDDVEKSIAAKEETVVEVELTVMQKKYYRAILDKNFSVLKKGGSKGANLGSLMNIVMELRKCCNHPYLISGVEEEENKDIDEDSEAEHELLINASGKLILMDKLLPRLFAEGHRVLVFSQMVKVLDLLGDYLDNRSWKYERIDGNIRGSERQAAIDRFTRSGSDCNIFLLCTRAGGQGINLTAADTVIIYDSDWNPQNDIQAQARCHRIGQTKDVKIYRLLTRNTYEREMFDKASKKLGLDRAVLTNVGHGAKVATSQTKEEVKKVDELLRVGAYDLFSKEAEEAAQKFCEEDIDSILQRRTTVVKHGDEEGQVTNPFSKASFVASEDNRMDVYDPDFWEKLLPEAASAPDPLLQLGPRQRKSVSRFSQEQTWDDVQELEEEDNGSDEDSDDEDDKDGLRMKGNKPWTKSERRRLQRAILAFGYGRCDDIATYGSLRRTHQQINAHCRAFAYLCERYCIAAHAAANEAASAKEAAEQDDSDDDGAEVEEADELAAAEDGDEGENDAEKPKKRKRIVRKKKSKSSVKEWKTPKFLVQIREEVAAEILEADRNGDKSSFIDPNVLLEKEASLKDPKWLAFLKRNCESFLQRLETLIALPYMLKQVELTPSLLTNASYLVQFKPAPWWMPPEDDIDLIRGVLMHGFGSYDAIRSDPTYRFARLKYTSTGTSGRANAAGSSVELKADETNLKEGLNSDSPATETASVSADKDATEAVSGGDDTEAGANVAIKAESPGQPLAANHSLEIAANSAANSAASVKSEGAADESSEPIRSVDNSSNHAAASSASSAQASGDSGDALSTSSSPHSAASSSVDLAVDFEAVAWPTVRALNKRFKQLTTAIGRGLKTRATKLNREKEKFAEEEKRRLVREERDAQRLLDRDQKLLRKNQVFLEWTKREKADFQRCILLVGEPEMHERAAAGSATAKTARQRPDVADSNLRYQRWLPFQQMAGLTKKTLKAIDEHFADFSAKCKVAVQQADSSAAVPKSATDVPNQVARRVTERLELMAKVRLLCGKDQQQTKQKILSSQTKAWRSGKVGGDNRLPTWWVPVSHDSALLHGVLEHGFQFQKLTDDPKYPFHLISEKGVADNVAETNDGATSGTDDKLDRCSILKDGFAIKRLKHLIEVLDAPRATGHGSHRAAGRAGKVSDNLKSKRSRPRQMPSGLKSTLDRNESPGSDADSNAKPRRRQLPPGLSKDIEGSSGDLKSAIGPTSGGPKRRKLPPGLAGAQQSAQPEPTKPTQHQHQHQHQLSGVGEMYAGSLGGAVPGRPSADPHSGSLGGPGALMVPLLARQQQQQHYYPAAIVPHPPPAPIICRTQTSMQQFCAAMHGDGRDFGGVVGMFAPHLQQQEYAQQQMQMQQQQQQMREQLEHQLQQQHQMHQVQQQPQQINLLGFPRAGLAKSLLESHINHQQQAQAFGGMQVYPMHQMPAGYVSANQDQDQQQEERGPRRPIPGGLVKSLAGQ
jgi:SNF2 family DNA or RNA helicase